jgi:hypothetical protein
VPLVAEAVEGCFDLLEPGEELVAVLAAGLRHERGQRQAVTVLKKLPRRPGGPSDLLGELWRARGTAPMRMV